MGLQTFVTALTLGSIYALMAAGLTVAYRPTNVFNLAQASFFTIGAMVAAVLVGDGLNWYLAVLVAVVVVAAVAAACWFVAVGPIVKRATDRGVMWIISTLAFALVVDNVLGQIWNDDPRILAPPPPLSNARIESLGSIVSSYQIFLILGTVAALWMMERAYSSRRGQAVLAIFEDREAAELRGLDVDRISMISVILGGVLGGVTGVVAAPILFASLVTGFPILISAFAAAVVGGLGSVRGTLLGGYVIAGGELLAIRMLSPTMQLFATFVIVMIVLLLRPQGFFGAVRTREV